MAQWLVILRSFAAVVLALGIIYYIYFTHISAASRSAKPKVSLRNTASKIPKLQITPNLPKGTTRASAKYRHTKGKQSVPLRLRKLVDPYGALIQAPEVFFTWTQKSEQFSDRHFCILDSFFRHHPDARITLYTTSSSMSSSPSFFARYIDLGYSLKVVHMNRRFLTKSLPKYCPGQGHREWLLQYPALKAELGYIAKHHFDEFLRFCLLYGNGGFAGNWNTLLNRPLTADVFVAPSKSSFKRSKRKGKTVYNNVVSLRFTDDLSCKHPVCIKDNDPLYLDRVYQSYPMFQAASMSTPSVTPSSMNLEAFTGLLCAQKQARWVHQVLSYGFSNGTYDKYDYSYIERKTLCSIVFQSQKTMKIYLLSHDFVQVLAPEHQEPINHSNRLHASAIYFDDFNRVPKAGFEDVSQTTPLSLFTSTDFLLKLKNIALPIGRFLRVSPRGIVPDFHDDTQDTRSLSLWSNFSKKPYHIFIKFPVDLKLSNLPSDLLISNPVPAKADLSEESSTEAALASSTVAIINLTSVKEINQTLANMSLKTAISTPHSMLSFISIALYHSESYLQPDLGLLTNVQGNTLLTQVDSITFPVLFANYCIRFVLVVSDSNITSVLKNIDYINHCFPAVDIMILDLFDNEALQARPPALYSDDLSTPTMFFHALGVPKAVIMECCQGNFGSLPPLLQDIKDFSLFSRPIKPFCFLASSSLPLVPNLVECVYAALKGHVYAPMPMNDLKDINFVSIYSSPSS